MYIKLFLAAVISMATFCSCKKNKDKDSPTKYEADVANTWMQMQIRLTRSTTGFNSIVSNRSFGYAGITLYESVLPAIPGVASLLSQIGGTAIVQDNNSDQYYWPASVNAAMASISRQFFENATAANLSAIDSLENVFKTRFMGKAEAGDITDAEAYGKKVANAIFNWSKTDGAHQAYKNVTDPAYVPPTGPGFWVPTAPASAPPILPHWGSNRPFISNSPTLSQPPAPTVYSQDPSSPFYQMVNELYTVSLTLTREDTTIARFWGDQPGNLNVPAHATNILIQLLTLTKKDLFEAAAAYAFHGVALNDASISVMKSKYVFNLLRPISYIRNVMGKPTWNAVLPTPPHPEYSAAHAVVSAASATVLGNIFGTQYKFTDHTYDELYGARTFNSFDDYAKEAGRSRLLAGIHYSPSIAAGLKQGNQIGELVNKLQSKK
jgi:hypothetical protein